MSVSLLIAAVGAVGILVPTSLVWIGQHSLSAGAFYVIAIARVAFGLLLISVAAGSGWPRTLRVFGYVIVVAGMATAVTALLAMDRARGIIEWWLQQGPAFVRLAGLLVLALGSSLAYACLPARRAA